ncbi:MAG: hypothetical protein KBF88_12185 [Polyangiaceae bacterium]|nr:hypothetical protein [Polyangiaceae bacterium]
MTTVSQTALVRDLCRLGRAELLGARAFVAYATEWMNQHLVPEERTDVPEAP